MTTIEKLRDQLSRAGQKMRDITAKAVEEERGLTPEEMEQHAKAREHYESLEKLIEVEQYNRSKESELDEIANAFVRDEDGEQRDIRKPGEQTSEEFEERTETGGNVVWAGGKQIRSKYGDFAQPAEHKDLAQAFDAFLRHGPSILDSQDRALVNERFKRSLGSEKRAQGVGTDAGGGYTIPEGFSNQLEVAMKAYSGIEPFAMSLTTSTGNNLPWPTVNDTAQEGAIIAEHAVDSEQDVTFAEIALGAFTYTSKVIRVSVELLQDSAFDMQALLVRMLGERLGRIRARHIAVGTGSGQPNGLMTAAPVGVTAASNSDITWNELLDLEHSVDPAYRTGSRFVFNDATLKALKQKVDGNSRPLWQPAVGSGANAVPATIDGFPYSIDLNVGGIAASTRSVAFGQLNKYIVRNVRGITMVTLRELYALNRQVAYNAFMRMDGELLDAGTNPVKVLVHPA